MAKPDISAQSVRELFTFDAQEGALRWAVKRQRIQVGSIAGSVTTEGYRYIGVGGARYYAHRLVWLHAYGAMPESEIDHINGVKDDNRLQNLRLADRTANMQNQLRPHKRNRSGFLGVTAKGGKWAAEIQASGITTRLGSFNSPEDASAAYKAAKQELHCIQN